MDYIEENLHHKLSTTNIDSKSCYSAFHFQRSFQAISGFSVKQYIRKRRLFHAAVLLKESRRSILDIVVMFQYGSQEAFTYAFVNCFRITPGKYRKQGNVNPFTNENKLF
ncbi:helix-turn-helix domain-containing protein [Bacillus spongiae]|uniref:Helix-turn-helix domain-containing protein n=1 Tax=Bacillus spongiae TaxID=2683610 RepID=A0ABU8HJF2_9BACI